MNWPLREIGAAIFFEERCFDVRRQASGECPISNAQFSMFKAIGQLDTWKLIIKTSFENWTLSIGYWIFPSIKGEENERRKAGSKQTTREP
jgi:hypothetical protein